MKTKHTQGEWAVNKYGSVVDSKDRTIKVSGICIAGHTDEEVEANTKLIAAAPELLQILSEIVTPHGFNTQSSLKERALNIIAKATL